MCKDPCHESPALKNGFALWEKGLWRLCFYGFLVVGAAGVYAVSPLGGATYAALSLVGLFAVVLPSLCSHCPYPTRYRDCLFLPPGLVRALYPFRGPRMSRAEGFAFLGVTLALIAAPQLWLLARPAWLLAFWALALPVLVAFPLYYCRRCRHFGCPANRVPRAERRRALAADS